MEKVVKRHDQRDGCFYGKRFDVVVVVLKFIRSVCVFFISLVVDGHASTIK